LMILCCGFVLEHVVQQIRSISKQVEYELKHLCIVNTCTVNYALRVC